MQSGLEMYIPRQHRAEIKRQLKEKWNYRCAYCDYLEKSRELTVDHITAICKGGSDEYENLLPCCRQCNISKGNRSVRQWYFESENYTTERWLKIKQHMSKEQPEIFAA